MKIYAVEFYKDSGELTYRKHEKSDFWKIHDNAQITEITSDFNWVFRKIVVTTGFDDLSRLLIDETDTWYYLEKIEKTGINLKKGTYKEAALKFRGEHFGSCHFNNYFYAKGLTNIPVTNDTPVDLPIQLFPYTPPDYENGEMTPEWQDFTKFIIRVNSLDVITTGYLYEFGSTIWGPRLLITKETMNYYAEPPLLLKGGEYIPDTYDLNNYKDFIVKKSSNSITFINQCDLNNLKLLDRIVYVDEMDQESTFSVRKIERKKYTTIIRFKDWREQ